ncbi:hypothetical protein [Mongoliimonas terrestris]|uniref:hypothetical protein n=1 Tax=Mongoliimonas terrestris TaxID=1709001 RepID=UPI000949810E|nr:hypothetical protein [Mongoliimonas terrestris]
MAETLDPEAPAAKPKRPRRPTARRAAGVMPVPDEAPTADAAAPAASAEAESPSPVEAPAAAAAPPRTEAAPAAEPSSWQRAAAALRDAAHAAVRRIAPLGAHVGTRALAVARAGAKGAGRLGSHAAVAVARIGPAFRRDPRRAGFAALAGVGVLALVGFLAVMVWQETTGTAIVARAPAPAIAPSSVAARNAPAIAPPSEGAGLAAGAPPRPVPLPNGVAISDPVERLVTTGSTARFAGGALQVEVSMISPSGGAVRASLNGGPLETLDEGVPVIVYAGPDVCSVTLAGITRGVGRIAAACSGGAGTRLGAEAAVEAELAPHRSVRVQPGETASFLDETVDIYMGSVTPGGAAVRLSIDGGVLEAMPVGGAKVFTAGDTLCALTVRAADPAGADLSVACFGRLAGPATVAGAEGVSNRVRAEVMPQKRVSLLGDRVRIALSMVSPDGEAVRWSLNDGGLRTTVFGEPAAVRVGDGACAVTPLARTDAGVRIKAACDDAAMKARLQITASETIGEVMPGASTRLIDGKVKLGLSMISPDGEAVRLAINDGDLRTLERNAPVSLDYGAGLCSVEYAGRAPSGAARIRAACDAAALASDILIPERTERAVLSPGDSRLLLEGRLAVRLSMISPDGEAIRFSANGGDLRTADQGKPIRFPGIEGACELTYLGREGTRAVMKAGCDAAALARPPFLPVRTERLDVGVADPRQLQSGRLSLNVNMISPDRRALRIDVNGGGLKTLERGRPLIVPVGRGACQIGFLSYTNGMALLEAGCDAGAFERAPVPPNLAEDVDLVYRTPVALFDGRMTVDLSMIAPGRDAVRVAVDGKLATLEADKPLTFPMEGESCGLVLTGIGADDRARLRVGCGAGLKAVVKAGPIPPETARIATGETARLLAGAVALKLEMISPSRTGLRVSIDGAKVSSLDRGVPRTIDLDGRPCIIDFRGVDRTGPVEQAIVEGRCE